MLTVVESAGIGNTDYVRTAAEVVDADDGGNHAVETLDETSKGEKADLEVDAGDDVDANRLLGQVSVMSLL